MGIFHEFIAQPIYLSPELREKWPYLQNCQSNKFFFNTVHNLINFSIFSQIKMGAGHFRPPPHINLREFNEII